MMRVIGIETVKRYHVRFSASDTAALKRGRFLPPFAEVEADLWWTKAEITHARKMFPRLEWGPLMLAVAREEGNAVPVATPEEKTAPAPQVHR